MRPPHYWKKAGAKSAPASILVFDCETHFGPTQEYEHGELQHLRLGCVLAYRLERGKRTRLDRLTFRHPDHFWSFVLHRLDKRRPLWVFAHNIAYDLGCVNFWRWRKEIGYQTDKSCVSANLFFMRGRINGCTLVFCDTCNYYRVPLKKLGKAMGVPKLPMPAYEESDDIWEGYCRNDVDIAARSVDQLIAFNRQHMLGPWQFSVAGLSFSAYRSAFMEHKVLVHSYRSSLVLERRAYYGGIVDTPRVGVRIEGPIYEMDVCSMYPHVCRENLPAKYLFESTRMGVAAIQQHAESRIVFADVELSSPDVPYPVKLKRGTYFVVGQFRTQLAHPELLEAIRLGHVKHVHRVAVYTAAPIFRKYMEFFVALKVRYRAEGNDAFDWITKMFATNLYGKTGQTTPRWEEWGEQSLQNIEDRWGLPPGSLENWYHKPPTMYEMEEDYSFPQIPVPFEIRDYFGKVEIKIGDAESRDSCPAIAATVTSYARCLLRSYQRTAGPGHWFYSDTDSIWVDRTGRDRLESANCVRAGVLGFLDQKSVHDWLLVHGPKDYETNAAIKLKGVRDPRNPNPDGSYTQLQFPSAVVQTRDRVQNGVYVRHVTKYLRRELTKCKLGLGGHTSPLVFPTDNPELVVGGKRRVNPR